ncbi:hypothetical protein HZA97_05710 [Candidatus Woesearchaeota archaeon]|nr:hypothetical protein [Candidatus Woesearchaeota archaeon]
MSEIKRGVYYDREINEPFEVLGFAKNAESLEELVLYRFVRTSKLNDKTNFVVESKESFLEKLSYNSEAPRLVFMYIVDDMND